MSIPAQAGGAVWTVTALNGGARQYSVTLDSSSDVSDLLEIYDIPIDTIHIYGSFNSQTVTLLGTNSTASAANGQALHRAHDPTLTFSTVGSEILAALVENPRFIYAKADGAVTSVVISIICVDRKAK